MIFEEIKGKNGGVVYATNGSKVDMHNCDIVRNSAIHKGGKTVKIGFGIRAQNGPWSG